MLTWSASAAASAVPALAACTCPAPHQLGNGSRDEVITGAGRQQQPFVGLALAAWQPQAAPHEGFGRHGLRGGVHRCNGWQTVPAVTAPPGLALPPCRFFSTVVPGWRVARPWPLFAAQGVRASARGCRSGTSGVSGRRFAPSTLTCRGSCRRCMGCMGQRGFKEGGGAACRVWLVRRHASPADAEAAAASTTPCAVDMVCSSRAPMAKMAEGCEPDAAASSDSDPEPEASEPEALDKSSSLLDMAGRACWVGGRLVRRGAVTPCKGQLDGEAHRHMTWVVAMWCD